MTQPINTENTHATNGRLAAGKKSPEGLARSARNAFKHGLTSKTFCLGHNEDAELFANHRQEFFDCFHPADAHEMQLVNQLIENAWLICRARAHSGAALRLEIEIQRVRFEELPNLLEADLSYLAVEALESRSNTYANLIRYAATHERAYQRAARALEVYRKNKTLTSPPPDSYNCLDPNNFFKSPEPTCAPDETKPPETAEPSAEAPSTGAAFAHQMPLSNEHNETKPSQTPTTQSKPQNIDFTPRE